MTDAPERIWANPVDTESNIPKWIDEIEVSHPYSYGGFDPTGTEYIRADLIPTWQPIETAPKDTPILIFGSGRAIEAIIGSQRTVKITGENGHVLFEFDDLNKDFTHWMPITPPTKEES